MTSFTTEDSAQLLLELFERTSDFVSSATSEGRILYVNPAGRALLGYTPDEPVEHLHISDFHPAWAYAEIAGAARVAVVESERWRGESALLTREGREVPVTQISVAHRGSDGELAFFSTIARDMSEQKRREDGLRLLADASEVLYSSLDYGTTLQAVARLAVGRVADYCLVDVMETDGTLRRVGTAHADPEQEYVLREAAAYPSDLHTGVPMRDLLRSGKPVLIDDTSDEWLRRVAADERHLELLRRLAPRRLVVAPMLARGVVLGSLWLVAVQPERCFEEDDLPHIAELARRAALAVDNARLYEDAQRALRTRDDVLGIVAHDLRNPVSTIYMAASILADLLPDPASAERRHVDVVHRSAERVNRLIQDLLDIRRIEAGELVVERRLEPVGALVDDAWEDLRPLASAASVALRREVGNALPPVLADRHRLLQVFSNLVGNALKFTPAGGEVTIRAERDGADVAFSVADTGAGVAPEHLPHLFRRFWQGSRGDRRGAGLGLSIVQGIVAAHGGRVAAESSVGHGTVVRFTIPTQAHTKAAEEEAPVLTP